MLSRWGFLGSWGSTAPAEATQSMLVSELGLRIHEGSLRL